MAKYSYELKKKVVEEYLSGEGGYKTLAKKHGIKAKVNIRQWVKGYQAFGDEGLMKSNKNKNYTFEFKLSVVDLYLTTEISYQEMALKVGINNPPLITKWVNDFRIAGPDAIKAKSKGRKVKMSKNKKTDKIDENADYLGSLSNGVDKEK